MPDGDVLTVPPRSRRPAPPGPQLRIPTPASGGRPAGPEAASHAPAVLRVRDFSFYYGAHRALSGIDLDIRNRAVTAVIGPSGCGKSTLLRAFNRMNDLIPGVKTEGRILFHDQDIGSPATDVVSLRRRIGMVFQRPNPFPKSIFENVVFGLRMLGVTDREELEARAERGLKQAALWPEVGDSLKRSALDLSGGQQQRLCIARCLAVEPEVILMDEPTSALDPAASSRIEDLLLDLKQHYAIVVVTHNMQQAARISDDTAFLLNGELIEFGSTAQVFTTPTARATEDYVTGRFG